MEADNGDTTSPQVAEGTGVVITPMIAATAVTPTMHHHQHQHQQQPQQQQGGITPAAVAAAATAAAGAPSTQPASRPVVMSSTSIPNNSNARCTDCSGRNPIKKRSRSAPWTVPEMLTLIDAKRKEREWCQMYKRGVKLPAAERWRIVAAHMEAKDMGRTGSQCQDKWENMMKDYKAVRDWQCMVGGTAKNYFKDMTNKERKDANLPPQMDEIVFYSLHAIQSEKEEKKEIDRMQKNGYMKLMPPSPGISPSEGTCHPPSEILCPQQQHHHQVGTAGHQQQQHPLVPMVPGLVLQQKDKEGSDEADVNSIDSDSSGKKKARRLDQPATGGFDNPVVFDSFVHTSGKDGSKEFIDCFMKVLEKSDRAPDAETKKKTKDTALLTRALVALADAVKMVAQKL